MSIIATVLGLLLVAFLGVGILSPYLPTEEDNRLIHTTCRLINLVQTETTASCSKVTHFEGREVSKESLYDYGCIKATVSLDYRNQTCRKAMLFRSLKDAKEMKFAFSADECKHGKWDITAFISSLGEEGKLRCAYFPNNPGLAYIVYPSPLWYIIPVIAVLVVSWFAIPKILDLFKSPSMEECTHYLQTNNLPKVKKCFNRRNVNEEVWKNTVVLSPLAIASQYGHVQVMDYLWTIGAHLHYTEDETGKNILHFACQGGNPEAIEWCLEKELPVNKVTSQNQTPLLLYILAPQTPDVKVIQSLIRDGTDVNITDGSNCTVLHHACVNDNWLRETKRQVVELFVKAGCPLAQWFWDAEYFPVVTATCPGRV